MKVETSIYSKKVLDDIKKDTGLNSTSDVINEALSLFEEYIKIIKEGGETIVNTNDGKKFILETNSYEKIKERTKKKI